MRRALEKIIDFVGEILAMATVCLILFLFVNAKFGFITGDQLTGLKYLRESAILLVVGLKALEFALKRGFIIIFFICMAIIAATAIFMFFPGVLPEFLRIPQEALLSV
ncbi:MAG: hypothetical protein LBP26_07065 [Clostridiales bacterium]|nr:hypothetical protein [Clostridiales bacterium]